MSDLSLILHCSPTLANLKTGSLFSAEDSSVAQQVEQWNEQLNDKDIFVKIIRQNGKRTVIYVYRKASLEADLCDKKIQKFLKKYGYKDFSVEGALKRLCERMVFYTEFPHEIGVFLSYPLNDILGFVKNKGHNCKLCGMWKVYDDVKAAERQFARYEKCRNIYTRLWQSGKTVSQLTVSVRKQSIKLT